MKKLFYKIVVYIRLILVVLTLCFLVPCLMFENFILGWSVERGFWYRRLLIKLYMLILNIKCEVKGSQIDQTALYVLNHRMMIDPVIFLRYCDAYIVSKAEVDSYPVLGLGARNAGVIFVKRDQRSSRASIKQKIGELLSDHKSVAIFPEGTVNTQALSAEFSRGSFDEAVRSNRPVVPVALDYSDRSVYWYTNISLAAHFLDVFSRPIIHAKLWIGEPIYSNDADFLVNEARRQVDKMLGEMRRTDHFLWHENVTTMPPPVVINKT